MANNISFSCISAQELKQLLHFLKKISTITPQKTPGIMEDMGSNAIILE